MTNTPRTHRHRRQDTAPASTSLASTIADAIAPTLALIDDSIDMLLDSAANARSDNTATRARLDKLLDDLSGHFHRLGADIADLDQRIQTLEAGDDV